MGRTLNYQITKDDNQKFTKKELEHMYNVSTYYNSDDLLKSINTAYKTKLKQIWTCENFFLSPVDYYPNWDSPIIKNMGRDNAWDYVNREYALLEKQGLHYFDIVDNLHKRKLVNYHGGGLKTNEVSSFTKTQGNEFNSMLVLKALVTISKLVPKALIHISDEGEYLLCPLHIKNGKALPLIDEVKKQIEGYAQRLIFAKDSRFNIMGDLKNTEGFSELFARDLGFNNVYGEMDIKFIDEKLRNLRLIEKALITETNLLDKGENMMYHYNIANLSPENWFNPDIFTRKVVVEDFLGYKMSPATLMQGFNGEGFGLTDEDSEKKSYEMLARMNKMLGVNESKSGLQLRILGAE